MIKLILGKMSDVFKELVIIAWFFFHMFLKMSQTQTPILNGCYDKQSSVLSVQFGQSVSCTTLKPFTNQFLSIQSKTTNIMNKIAAGTINTYSLSTKSMICPYISSKQVKLRSCLSVKNVQATNILAKSWCSVLKSKTIQYKHMTHKSHAVQSIKCTNALIDKIHLERCTSSSIRTDELTSLKVNSQSVKALAMKSQSTLCIKIKTEHLRYNPTQSTPLHNQCLYFDGSMRWVDLKPSICINKAKKILQLPFILQSCTPDGTTFQKTFQCKSLTCSNINIQDAYSSVAADVLSCKYAQMSSICCKTATIEKLLTPLTITPKCTIHDGIFTIAIDAHKAHCQLPMLKQYTDKNCTVIEADVHAEHTSANCLEVSALKAHHLQHARALQATVASASSLTCKHVYLKDRGHEVLVDRGHVFMYKQLQIVKKEHNWHFQSGNSDIMLEIPTRYQSFNERTCFTSTFVSPHLHCNELCADVSSTDLLVKKVHTLNAAIAGVTARKIFIKKPINLKLKYNSFKPNASFQSGKLSITYAPESPMHLLFPTTHYTDIGPHKTCIKSHIQCHKVMAESALLQKCSSNSVTTLSSTALSVVSDIALISDLRAANVCVKSIVKNTREIDITQLNKYRYACCAHGDLQLQDCIDNIQYESGILTINHHSVHLPTSNQSCSPNHTDFTHAVECLSVKAKNVCTTNIRSQDIKCNDFTCTSAEVSLCECDVLHASTVTTNNLYVNNMEWPLNRSNSKQITQGFIIQKNNELTLDDFQIDPSITNTSANDGFMVLSGSKSHRLHWPVQNVTKNKFSLILDGKMRADVMATSKTVCKGFNANTLFVNKVHCQTLNGNVIDSDIFCNELLVNQIESHNIPPAREGYLVLVSGRLQWVNWQNTKQRGKASRVLHAICAGDRRHLFKSGCKIEIHSENKVRSAELTVDGNLSTFEQVRTDEYVVIDLGNAYRGTLVMYVSSRTAVKMNNNIVHCNSVDMQKLTCIQLNIPNKNPNKIQFQFETNVHQINFF